METLDSNYKIKPMSVGDWVLTLFITGLPVIGLIMLFIWAFGDNNKPDRANYSKASLIWMAIAFFLVFIFMMFFGGLAMLNSMD